MSMLNFTRLMRLLAPIMIIGSIAVKVRKKLAVEPRLPLPETVTLLTVASWLRVTLERLGMTTSSVDVGIEPPVQVAAVCQREPSIDGDTEVICAAYDCGENNRVKIIVAIRLDKRAKVFTLFLRI